MNINNKNKRSELPRFQLLLALTLLACPLLQALTISELAAARTLKTTNKAEQAMVNTSRVQEAYLQPGGIKVLAEGFQSKITKPFVAVVRDVETYAALRKLDDNLPKLDVDFFQVNVVLAAFLGERNTGGFSVEITPSPIDINVLEKKPGKGMMVPEMVTSPFKIVALQGVGNAAVRLTLDDAWRQQRYRLTSGKFRMSGGIAGASDEFGLQGFVHVMREGNLASFSFRIVGSETSKRRLLMEFATGVTHDENINISRMSADSLVGPPNGGLSATAVFSEEGRKFSLSLMSRPSMIADGYSGQGTIEAELDAPPTKP